MNTVSRSFPRIPVETALEARKVYNIQHVYLRIGDQLEEILRSVDLGLLDPSSSLSPEMVFRLALVTAFQFAESLPDPAASEATRKRMDWKYAIYLPIRHPGISANALCEFRKNLLSSPKGQEELSRLANLLARFGLYAKSAHRKRNPAEALPAVCRITRLYRISEAMKSALSVLGSIAPDWLLANSLPYWYQRYGHHSRVLYLSAEWTKQEEIVQAIGVDGAYLLKAISDADLTVLKDLPEILSLKKIWQEQFCTAEEKVVWKKEVCVGCNLTDQS